MAQKKLKKKYCSLEVDDVLEFQDIYLIVHKFDENNNFSLTGAPVTCKIPGKSHLNVLAKLLSHIWLL